jgi:hypothetical protein
VVTSCTISLRILEKLPPKKALQPTALLPRSSPAVGYSPVDAEGAVEPGCRLSLVAREYEDIDAVSRFNPQISARTPLEVLHALL